MNANVLFQSPEETKTKLEKEGLTHQELARPQEQYRVVMMPRVLSMGGGDNILDISRYSSSKASCSISEMPRVLAEVLKRNALDKDLEDLNAGVPVLWTGSRLNVPLGFPVPTLAKLRIRSRWQQRGQLGP